MYRKALLIAVMLLIAVTAFTLVGGAGAAPSPTASSAGSVPVVGHVGQLQVEREYGAVYVGFRVYLGWNNPAARRLSLRPFPPGSASYGKYLTPAQFRQQFAPSQSQIAQVKSWLQSAGLSITYSPQNNHYVAAEGTIAQAQAAFGTPFAAYKEMGLTLRSPSADVSIPSSLAGIVSGVIGLDDSAQLVHTDHVKADAARPAAFVTGTPCSTYWGEKLATGFPIPMERARFPTRRAATPRSRSSAPTASADTTAPARPWP